jgi:hypothetical protein
MLNIEKIEAALNAQPLCQYDLTRSNGATQRCAIGAMLAYAGVPDETLREADLDGADSPMGIWERWGDVLKREYGLTNSMEVAEITAHNDTAEPTTRRNKVLTLCRDIVAGARLVPSFTMYDA